MSVLLLVCCIFLLIRRLRAGGAVAMPLIVGCVAAGLSVGLIAGAVGTVRSLSGINPADRATILAAAISEGINTLVFELVVEIPIVVAALLLERWLGSRRTKRNRLT